MYCNWFDASNLNRQISVHTHSYKKPHHNMQCCNAKKFGLRYFIVVLWIIFFWWHLLPLVGIKLYNMYTNMWIQSDYIPQTWNNAMIEFANLWFFKLKMISLTLHAMNKNHTSVHTSNTYHIDFNATTWGWSRNMQWLQGSAMPPRMAM